MLKSYGASRIGLIRKTNEDCVYAADGPLYVLADGMGGYKGGKIASRAAVDAVVRRLRAPDANPISEQLLQEAVMDANQAVLEKKTDDTLSLMGTTLIVAFISENRLYWAHVGDSRLYLYHDSALRQITEDHSFVMRLLSEGKITKEEMKNHPRKNEITRAVGIHHALQIDTGIIDMAPTDEILVCSDGLSGMIDDDSISRILAEYGNTPQKCVETLLDRVYDAGAHDNVSAIVIRYESEDKI